MNSDIADRARRAARARELVAARRRWEERWRMEAECAEPGMKAYRALQDVIYGPPLVVHPTQHVFLVTSSEWAKRIAVLGRDWRAWVGRAARDAEPYIHEDGLGVASGAAVFRVARAPRATERSICRAIDEERHILREFPVSRGRLPNWDSEWGMWMYFREMSPHLHLCLTSDASGTMGYESIAWYLPIRRVVREIATPVPQPRSGRWRYLAASWREWTSRAQHLLETAAGEPHSLTAKTFAATVNARFEEGVSANQIRDHLTEMSRRGLLVAAAEGYSFGKWPAGTPIAIREKYRATTST